MGFRIELEEEDLKMNLKDLNIGPKDIKILTHLKENPVDVFGYPYFCKKLPNQSGFSYYIYVN